MTFRRAVDVVQYAVLFAAAVTVAALFLNQPAAGGGSDTTYDSTEGVDPAAMFASQCGACHGDDGSGGFGPKLSDGAVVEAFPDPADQIEIITEGRNGMPPFGNDLTADEIEAIVEYTRSEL